MRAAKSGQWQTELPAQHVTQIESAWGPNSARIGILVAKCYESEMVSTNSSTIDNGESSLPQVGLGTHSARALAFFFGCTAAAKVVTLLAQIILLQLLGPHDFGVVQLALTVTAFIQLLGQTGVLEVLVRRRAFQAWAIPGFWLALTLGILSSVLILLCAARVLDIWARSGRAQTIVLGACRTGAFFVAVCALSCSTGSTAQAVAFSHGRHHQSVQHYAAEYIDGHFRRHRFGAVQLRSAGNHRRLDNDGHFLVVGAPAVVATA